MMNLIKEIDLMPFTRTLWRVDIEPAFKNIFADLQRDCHMAELRTVAENIRSCATTHIGSDRVMRDMELLDDLGLCFMPLRRAKRVSGFAHKFYDDIAPGEPYDVYGVVGTSRADILAFKRASESNNHIIMGELLGYPSCCVNFFNRIWPTGEYDPLFSAALATPNVKMKGEFEIEIGDFYPECSILLRYVGIRLVPNLVCSFKCEKSKELGQKFLQYIDEKQELLKILASQTSWSCWRGVATIATPWNKIITNSMSFAEERVIRLV